MQSVAGGSCRRTRPQTPQAPSEGPVPRHPPERRLCPAGLARSRRGPRASTPSRPQRLRRVRAPMLSAGVSRHRGRPPRWRANGAPVALAIATITGETGSGSSYLAPRPTLERSDSTARRRDRGPMTRRDKGCDQTRPHERLRDCRSTPGEPTTRNRSNRMKKFLAVAIVVLAALRWSSSAQASTAGQRNALNKAQSYLRPYRRPPSPASSSSSSTTASPPRTPAGPSPTSGSAGTRRPSRRPSRTCESHRSPARALSSSSSTTASRTPRPRTASGKPTTSHTPGRSAGSGAPQGHRRRRPSVPLTSCDSGTTSPPRMYRSSEHRAPLVCRLSAAGALHTAGQRRPGARAGSGVTPLTRPARATVRRQDLRRVAMMLANRRCRPILMGSTAKSGCRTQVGTYVTCVTRAIWPSTEIRSSAISPSCVCGRTARCVLV